MSSARNWDAARNNRRMRRELVTGETYQQARGERISRVNYPPTEKQYAFIQSLCREHNIPYSPPATRGDASREIDRLLKAKKQPKK